MGKPYRHGGMVQTASSLRILHSLPTYSICRYVPTNVVPRATPDGDQHCDAAFRKWLREAEAMAGHEDAQPGRSAATADAISGSMNGPPSHRRRELWISWATSLMGAVSNQWILREGALSARADAESIPPHLFRGICYALSALALWRSGAQHLTDVKNRLS